MLNAINQEFGKETPEAEAQIRIIMEKDDPALWGENHFNDPDTGETPLIVKDMFKPFLRCSKKNRGLRVGRQIGKCSNFYTHIQLSDGNRECAGNIYTRVGEGGRFGVLSLNPTTFKHQKDMATIFDNGMKPCTKVDTWTGLSTTNTDNHPYLVWRENMEYPDWIAGEDLRVGDRIAITRDLSACSVSVKDSTLTPQEAELLGYIIGDGGTSTNTVKFTTPDDELVERINHILPEIGMNTVLAPISAKYQYSFIMNDKPEPSTQGRIRSDIRKFVTHHGLAGKLSKHKVVPPEIFTSSDEAIAAFLGAYWSTDGWISIKPDDGSVQACVTSASHELIRGVRTLLLRLGINCYERYKLSKYDGKGFDSWTIWISDSRAVEIFKNKIPIHQKKKAEKLAGAVLRESNSNTDTIPRGVWLHVKKELKSRGWSDRHLLDGHIDENARIRTKYCPNREKLARQTEKLDDEFLRNISDSDIMWDEVTAVTPAGEQQTYAIQVDETHNLITDNIISHNTVHMCLDILHTAYHSKNAVILVLVPEKKLMNRMLDIISNFLRKSDIKNEFWRNTTANKKARTSSKPEEGSGLESAYDNEIVVGNGSSHIRFFFTGNNPDKVRGQTGTHIYIDETEYHPEKLQPVVQGILKANTRIFLSCLSTPRGIIGSWFYNFCTTCADPENHFGEEFHLTPEMDPNWPELEKVLRTVIFDDVTWALEVRAEFRNALGAVYKSELVDEAVARSKIGSGYFSSEAILNSIEYQGYRKILGVDWNNPQNGVRLVEINEINGKPWVVRNEIISFSQYTQTLAVKRIMELYDECRYDAISVDVGYGATQIEMIISELEKRGINDPDKILFTVDSVKKEDIELKYTDPGTGRELTREFKMSVKQILVEVVAKYLERGLTILKEEDRPQRLCAEIKNLRRKDGVQKFTYEGGGHSLSALQLGLYAYDKVKKRDSEPRPGVTVVVSQDVTLKDIVRGNTFTPGVTFSSRVFGNVGRTTGKRTATLDGGQRRASLSAKHRDPFKD